MIAHGSGKPDHIWRVARNVVQREDELVPINAFAIGPLDKIRTETLKSNRASGQPESRKGGIDAY
jgi:hypothetical protein